MHVFKARGLAKGALVLIPVIAYFLLEVSLNIGSITDINSENIGALPLVAAMQVTSALMQNALFRGLLVTALFVKLNSTKNERVKSVFRASVLYLAIYIPMNILNTGSLELMQLVNTFIVSLGFCSAYLYSKSLISLILVQGIWQILGSAIDVFGVDSYVQITPLALVILLAILISIVIFAIVFSRRAEPFVFAADK